MRIIDLSQEIYPGMPVFDGHPQVTMVPAVTHEQRAGMADATTVSPVVHALGISEHAGTHVDAFNHFGRAWVGKSIDTMPLERFFTQALCLDFSHKGLRELITVPEIQAALKKQSLEILPQDTVLLHTDHYRRHYNGPEWPNGPGISVEVARWFGELAIAGFGVETRSPGVLGQGNKEIHTIGGEMGYIHYENLVNLHLLLDKGRFTFAALPLKIRGGTGSPVRAVALVD